MRRSLASHRDDLLRATPEPARTFRAKTRELNRNATETNGMYISTAIIEPLVALIAGVLILLAPRLLNYVVAAYLIVVGLMGVLPQLG